MDIVFYGWKEEGGKLIMVVLGIVWVRLMWQEFLRAVKCHSRISFPLKFHKSRLDLDWQISVYADLRVKSLEPVSQLICEINCEANQRVALSNRLEHRKIYTVQSNIAQHVV